MVNLFFVNLITGSPFKIGPSFEQTLKLFNDRLPNLVKITDCSGEEVRKEKGGQTNKRTGVKQKVFRKKLP